MSWRRLVSWRSGRTSCWVSTTLVTSTAPSAKQAALTANGSAMPMANSRAPIGGVDELVHEQEPALEPRVGDAEVRVRDDRRQQAAGRRRRRRSRDVPRTNSAARTKTMLIELPTIVSARTPRTIGPAEVDEGDDPAPVEAVRDGARRRPEDQLRDGLAQDRERDEQRVAGLRGDQQRAGGQRDAVADVGDQRLAEQPPEVATEARRGDGLDDGRKRGTHRAAGYRRSASAPG